MMKRISAFTLIELLIVVAIIAILAAIAVPNFLEAQTRSKVSRVRADQRSLATGIEAYYVDNNSYPAHASSVSGQDGPYKRVGNKLTNVSANLQQMPSFRMRAATLTAAGGNLATLTTPVAYITSLFSDPFLDTKGASFMYSRSGDSFGSGWLIWSVGPDTDEIASTDPPSGDIKIQAGTPPFVLLTVYNPNATVPQDILINSTYDPTNGTNSNGDVWRVKQ